MSKVLDLRTGSEIGTSQDKDVIKEMSKPRSIKLSDYPSEVCPKCGGKIFTTGFVIKDIPGLEVGAVGRDKVPMPIDSIPIFVCAKCGEFAPMMHYEKELEESVNKLLGNEKEDE